MPGSDSAAQENVDASLSLDLRLAPSAHSGNVSAAPQPRRRSRRAGPRWCSSPLRTCIVAISRILTTSRPWRLRSAEARFFTWRPFGWMSRSDGGRLPSMRKGRCVYHEGLGWAADLQLEPSAMGPLPTRRTSRGAPHQLRDVAAGKSVLRVGRKTPTHAKSIGARRSRARWPPLPMGRRRSQS